MELFYKKNTDLTYQELEVLYQLYSYNNHKILDKDINKRSLKRKNINSVEHKEKWIASILNDNSLFCVECVENGNLIGFATIILEKDENYINEMHIIPERQHDGVTFRQMMGIIVQNSQVGKDFTGRIWNENYEAKKIFGSMGALPSGKKYRLSYDKLIQWLNRV